MRTNGQLGTGQASLRGDVLAWVEEGGAFKGSEEELGACGKIRLLMEEEIPVDMEFSDVTLWEWPGMINELEYWRP